MTIPDRVWFLMPRDEQLQVTAIAIVQHFVNTYAERMKINDTTGGEGTFKLEYTLRFPEGGAVWDILHCLDLKLDPKPVRVTWVDPFGEVDMLVDLTEERLGRFSDWNRHAYEICGMLVGELHVSVPIIRQVQPSINGRWLVFLDGVPETGDIDYVLDLEYFDLAKPGDLERTQDKDYRGVIGRASKETYIAAAMGLPVVEITTSKPTWLSKWINRAYRMVVDEGDPSEVRRQVKQAVSSIEEMLRRDGK